MAQEATDSTTASGTDMRLHATPDGAVIGAVGISAPVTVIEESGGWMRVRVEGWVRSAAEGSTDDGTPLGAVTLAALRSRPDRYVGRIVEWEVQYLATERADTLRTDLPRGQPYLLVRDPGGEPGLAYVTLPADRVGALDGVQPLQRITLVGRIVVGRSHLTGHPILELVEIRR